MVRVDLTEEECRTLASYLEEDISDLRMEIVDTDRVELKDTLRARKRVLLGVVEKLRQAEGREGTAARDE